MQLKKLLLKKKKKNLFEINFFRFLYKIFLKKSFFFYFFIYKNFYNVLNLHKIYLYRNILNFYKLNLYLPVLYSYQFKYSWIEARTKYEKFFFNNLENYFFVEFFPNTNSEIFFDKYYLIENYIKFKNKNGLFKKVNSVKNLYLTKYNFFKNFNNLNLNSIKIVNKDSLFFKNFDFVEKKLSIFKNNRKILKNIFKKNKKIDFYVNKFFKKFSKMNNYNFMNVFEFSISNILLNSQFFLNKNDVFFFIKNKYVYVNNKSIFNINYEVNKGDIVNICFNKYYFFLYRKYINNLNLNVNKYNNFFKKNNNNLNNDFNFINKLTILKNDVPSYIEVDYMSMSLILLHKNIYNYNCFDLKLLTVFLKRLNSWKYII